MVNLSCLNLDGRKCQFCHLLESIQIIALEKISSLSHLSKALKFIVKKCLDHNGKMKPWYFLLLANLQE